MSQMGLAGVLELFGGLLVVLGLLRRPVAAVLALLFVAFWARSACHGPGPFRVDARFFHHHRAA